MRKKGLTRSASTNTLGVVTLLQQPVNSADGELETSLGRTRLGLGLPTRCLATRLSGFSTFAYRTREASKSRHDEHDVEHDIPDDDERTRHVDKSD